tara:strand:+ start:8509 stop:11661 length:3153 start_codon:yes stop_codon:yes gene_type:complete
MSQEGYTDITILEANRLASVEGKSQNDENLALFTNKINNGLKLNIGDSVSVHSCFVSEIGAQGGEIEIKGSQSKSSRTLTYNIVTHTDLNGINEGSETDNTGFISGSLSLPNYYFVNKRETVTKEVFFRDDEINLVINPYKNANGEHYISLPYVFANPANLTMYNGAEYVSTANTYISWNQDRSINASFTGNKLPTPWNPALGGRGDANTIWNGNICHIPERYSYNLADKKQYTNLVSQNASQVSIKHDNSQYAIYQRRNTAHGVKDDYAGWSANIARIVWGTTGYLGIDPIPMTNASYVYGDYQDSPQPFRDPEDLDPALHPYVRVMNLVTAKAKQGFNSPEDVASSLTEDIQRLSSIQQQEGGVQGTDQDVVLSMTAQNELNKTYNCADVNSFSHVNACSAYYMKGTGSISDNEKTDIYEYLSQFETIGVKRPDLYELGRTAFSPAGNKTEDDFTTVGTQKNILSDIPFTEENINKINDLFIAQKRYPELFNASNIGEDGFTWTNASAENQRFLHMNLSASHINFVGYDLTESGAIYWRSTWGSASPYATRQDQTFCSAPFFINVNPTREYMGWDPVGGTSFKDAIYGWAIKVNDKIGFQIEPLPSIFLYGEAGTSVGVGRRIGWDYHFTAYGCPCILPYSGFSDRDGNGYNRISRAITATNRVSGGSVQLSTILKKIYIGSPDTQIAYNSNENRFEIQELHKSEVIGNPYNAGLDASNPYSTPPNASGYVYTAPLVSVPVNPQASQKVYKLNKQLLANNWSPSMSPYNTVTHDPIFSDPTHSGSYTHTQPLAYLNPNMEAQTLYDSNCGNYVLDWGVDETYWRDSLWNILGFRHSQTLGDAPTNTRLKNSLSFSNQKEPTTNADITSNDLEILTRNVYGAPNFNLTPPSANLPPFQTPANLTKESFYPAVSVTQTVGQVLRAEKLPTRTLRPYFTIRSDIVSNVNYFGSGDSGIPLPVVAVVDKVSNTGDYFFSKDSLIFTITKSQTLTSVTTSIHDPDGSFSKLDPNSAVLYKVTRQIKADMTPVTTILSTLKTKKQRLAFEKEIE